MLQMPTLRRGLIAASLALSVAVSTPAIAQETPSAALGRNIRVLATDPRNFDALIGAGRAALDMGDVQAAAGFFGRAQEIRPNDWHALVGVGGAMVQSGDPRGALQQFDQAQRAGAPVYAFALDRGMARDLLGDQAGAQADYRSAFGSTNDDEARRRLALSLAISRKKGDALAAIQPLLNRRDPGAQRSRAFVLALAGDRSGAAEAIEQVMPGTSAQFERFFRYLPNLSAAEKAAAVHLGVFPEDAATRVAVAEPIPQPVAQPPVKTTPRLASNTPVRTPAPQPVRRPAPPPAAKPVTQRVLAQPDLGASVRTTLRNQVKQKEVRNALSDRADAAKPGFSLPSQAPKVAEVAPPLASEAEPLVPIDTAPPASINVDNAQTVNELPKGAEGPVLPAEDVRLSGIDKLLATIAEAPPPSQPKIDNRAAKAAAAKKAKDDAKKLADKKAADAKAAADKKAKEEAAALGTPGTNWIQLAGGSNRNFMAAEYRKLAAKSSQLKKRSGYVTAGKDYYRLLIGPFDSKAEAQAFVNKLAKDGVDGFSWTRTPAQIKIEKLP